MMQPRRKIQWGFWCCLSLAVIKRSNIISVKIQPTTHITANFRINVLISDDFLCEEVIFANILFKKVRTSGSFQDPSSTPNDHPDTSGVPKSRRLRYMDYCSCPISPSYHIRGTLSHSIWWEIFCEAIFKFLPCLTSI